MGAFIFGDIMTKCLEIRDVVHKLVRELHRMETLRMNAELIGFCLDAWQNTALICELIFDLLGVSRDNSADDPEPEGDDYFCRDYYTDMIYELVEQNRSLDNDDIDAFMGEVLLSLDGDFDG